VRNYLHTVTLATDAVTLVDRPQKPGCRPLSLSSNYPDAARIESVQGSAN
jgi:hypothetical protein